MVILLPPPKPSKPPAPPKPPPQQFSMGVPITPPPPPPPPPPQFSMGNVPVPRPPTVTPPIVTPPHRINPPGFVKEEGNTVAPQPPPPPPSPPPPPPPPPPKPINPWITERQFTGPSGIKQAQPDIILDPVIDTSADYIVERFFEELGGTELASISRYDLIDGTPVIYSPIANLSNLRRTYNPNNLIAIDVSLDEFSRSPINLIERGMNPPFFNSSGNLVISVDVVKDEEEIQTDISVDGTISRIEL